VPWREKSVKSEGQKKIKNGGEKESAFLWAAQHNSLNLLDS